MRLETNRKRSTRVAAVGAEGVLALAAEGSAAHEPHRLVALLDRIGATRSALVTGMSRAPLAIIGHGLLACAHPSDIKTAMSAHAVTMTARRYVLPVSVSCPTNTRRSTALLTTSTGRPVNSRILPLVSPSVPS